MDFRDQFLEHMDAMPLPPIGDDEKKLERKFTEADLNTIAFAVSFTQHALLNAPFRRIRRHYGASLEKLAERLHE